MRPAFPLIVLAALAACRQTAPPPEPPPTAPVAPVAAPAAPAAAPSPPMLPARETVRSYYAPPRSRLAEAAARLPLTRGERQRLQEITRRHDERRRVIIDAQTGRPRETRAVVRALAEVAESEYQALLALLGERRVEALRARRDGGAD